MCGDDDDDSYCMHVLGGGQQFCSYAYKNCAETLCYSCVSSCVRACMRGCVRAYVFD